MRTPVAVCAIWIDWYSYHVARFRALAEHRLLNGRVRGVELVGGAGVHRGLVFRSTDRSGLPMETLLPGTGWADVPQDKMAKLIWKKLDQLDPAAVLVPGYYTLPALSAAIWARKRGRKAILMTESTSQDHRRRWWKETVKSGMIRSLFSAAIAGGKRHRAYLKDLGFPAAKIGGCYDVVDNEYFRAGAERLREAETASSFQLPDDYFLYVGRLAPEKNLHMLLRSVADIRGRGWQGALVLAGDGPMRASLEESVRELGLQSTVRFAGQKTTPELVPLYAFARALVLPSKREPWGLVVNEAMASGLPVAVSNSSGCADDLVDAPWNGGVFDPESQPELTGLLWNLALLSTEELRRMGCHGQKMIAKYSPENWAEEVSRLA